MLGAWGQCPALELVILPITFGKSSCLERSGTPAGCTPIAVCHHISGYSANFPLAVVYCGSDGGGGGDGCCRVPLGTLFT